MSDFTCTAFTLSALFNACLLGLLTGVLIGFVLGSWPGHTVEKIDSEDF
jgi:hypothetical protein